MVMPEEIVTEVLFVFVLFGYPHNRPRLETERVFIFSLEGNLNLKMSC